ncbi:MAG TPA: hypothetical protein PLF15_00655 [bacterium]|nr:hypothetical protein [bacterium]
MSELSFTTINIIVLTKVILFIFVFLLLFLIYKKNNKPWCYLLLITIVIFVFYLVFSYPLKKMLWGNSGDETYIFTFLKQVMAGNYFSDFYYGWLPPFYPPLYFWITGTIAHFFTNNGIVAAKIGVLGTVVIFFIGSYLWQKFFYQKINQNNYESEDNLDSFHKSPWFWMLLPCIFFILLDFDIFIFKPYEVVTALFSVIFVGFLYLNFFSKKWHPKFFLFSIISGGILFLTYYFWWFILIPVILFLIYLSSDKIKNLKRIIITGIGIFILSSIFLIPLLLSLLRGGIENGQAGFFIPQDLSTYVPWITTSFWGSSFFIFGIFGLIKFSSQKLVKSSLYIFIMCYLYQFINLIYFLIYHKTFLAAKSFPILSAACLSIGAAYLINYLYNITIKKYRQMDRMILILVIIIISILPLVKFIDDPIVRAQIDKDLIPNRNSYLVEIIKNITDYNKKIWLSGSVGDLSAFLSLSYYVSYSQHFSHPAAFYSKRIIFIKQLANTSNGDEFYQLIVQQSQPLITGLILYKNNSDLNNYYLYFNVDNFPNGVKELIIKFNKDLVSEKYWQKEYEDSRITIFTLK